MTILQDKIANRLTDRLRLRPPRLGDLDAVIAIFSQPVVVAHRPDPSPENAADCRARLERDLDHWHDHGFGRWALIFTDTVIGFGGLTLRDGFAGLNLSYHLHPAYWRHGLASEFALAAVEMAFMDLAAPHVLGMVRPANIASCHVLENAGLTLERDIVYGGHPGLLYLKRRGDA
ncbi:MAG TPA: GNAT family N-acetyltransferase [Dongiaceae bacterium]